MRIEQRRSSPFYFLLRNCNSCRSRSPFAFQLILGLRAISPLSHYHFCSRYQQESALAREKRECPPLQDNAGQNKTYLIEFPNRSIQFIVFFTKSTLLGQQANLATGQRCAFHLETEQTLILVHLLEKRSKLIRYGNVNCNFARN